MTDTALQTVEEKHAGGRPPEITESDQQAFLDAIGEGLTQGQAATVVGHDPDYMMTLVKKHPELSLKVARAKSDCILARIKAQKNIGDTTDIKGLNAAVKANACLLAAYDDRFRKARDGEGPGGGGTSITVITAVQPQSIAGFFAAGGKAQPQAIKILIQKYGQAILGEITEETALKIAAESMSENKNGTQLEGGGGQRPADSAIPIPNHPHTKTTVIEAPPTPDGIETYLDRSDPLPESVILDSPVRPEEAPDGA